jgi:hypothetical protein
MIYERIDIGYIYTHLIWAYVFLIYLITSLMAIYTIWAELRNKGAE